MWEWRWLYAPLLTVLFNRTTQEGKIRNSWPWIVSGTYFPSISLLNPFLSLFIPVRSWDDSDYPLLSFISLTLLRYFVWITFANQYLLTLSNSSDLTWLAGSLPQPLTGAWLVIYQSTVAFLPPTSTPRSLEFPSDKFSLSVIACDSWKTGRLTCWWQKDFKSEGLKWNDWFHSPIPRIEGWILLCCWLSSSYLIPFLSFCGC